MGRGYMRTHYSSALEDITFDDEMLLSGLPAMPYDAADAITDDDENVAEIPGAAAYRPSSGQSEDGVQNYLRSIGRVKLLSATEEIELARRVNRGDEIAKKRLVQANLRLVVSVAKKYQNR